MVRNRRPERARRGGSIGGEDGVGAARRGAHAPRAAALPIAPQPPPQPHAAPAPPPCVPPGYYGSMAAGTIAPRGGGLPAGGLPGGGLPGGGLIPGGDLLAGAILMRGRGVLPGANLPGASLIPRLHHAAPDCWQWTPPAPSVLPPPPQRVGGGGRATQKGGVGARKGGVKGSRCKSARAQGLILFIFLLWTHNALSLSPFFSLSPSLCLSLSLFLSLPFSLSLPSPNVHYPYPTTT